MEYQKGRAVIAFGTRGSPSNDWERRRLGSIDAGKNSATTIRKTGEERGINIHPRMLHFAVVGMRGPWLRTPSSRRGMPRAGSSESCGRLSRPS